MRILLRLALAVALLLGAVKVVERLTVYPFDARLSPIAQTGLTGFSEQAVQGPNGDIVLWQRKSDSDRPTVFYLHGNAGNLNNRVPRFQRFAERGYGVIAFGYPGSSGSGGWPSERNIAAAVRATYDLILASPEMSPDDLVIYGESLGAAIAIDLIIDLDNSARPAALVLESPFTSLLDVAKDLNPVFAIATGFTSSRWDSISKVPELELPTLVLHGEDDTLIPLAQGKTLFDALGSRDKELMIVEGAGHTTVWKADAQRKLYAFLNLF